MRVNAISEAKAQLSALIERALAGEEVIIARAGKPVVKLVRHVPAASARQPGTLKGQIRIEDDFDSLPPEEAAAFGILDE